MREVGIGRVLVASLHQSIADILPMRLGFYENWLNAEGMRGGTIGVAPLSAVLSFLRQEGEAYDQVMRRAGQYAAEWTVESMKPFERTMLGAGPAWWRTRLLLRVGTRLVRDSCHASRATVRVRRGVARVQLRESVFCGVREPAAAPLCVFYASAFARLLSLFELDAVAQVSECRGARGSNGVCVVVVSLRSAASPVVEDAA